MGKLEEGIPTGIRKRLGNDFKLTKDTAKILYFEMDCSTWVFSNDIKQFYSQFSDEELIKWNNEYFSYMDKKLDDYYNQDITLDNLLHYSIDVEFMSEVYTNKKENYILYLNNIKKYMTKYEYIMFYSIDDNKYVQMCSQYPFAELYKIFMLDIDDRFLNTESQNRITLHKMYPKLDKYGLIPIFIHLGYKDLLEESLKIYSGRTIYENVFNDKQQEIMNKLGIKYGDNLASYIADYRYDDFNEINSYLKLHNIDIVLK